MKTKILSSFLIVSLLCSTSSFSEDQPMIEMQPKQVGKAAEDSAAAARSKKWQNIALAAAAVSIGVAILLLVSHNHSKHAD